MRYISKLTTESLSVDSINYILPPGWVASNPLLSATIHDSDSDEDIVVSPGKLTTEKCLGNSGVEGVAVRHSYKTAMLHNYVYGVTSYACEPILDLDNMDYCAYELPGRVIGRYKELAINTGDGAIQFSGFAGSVVHKKSRFEVTSTHMTLYELLGRLCRAFGMNIMLYDAVHLYSEVEYYRADIKFVHGAMADRFFAKMYMDVVGK